MSALIGIKSDIIPREQLDAARAFIEATGFRYGWKSNTNLPFSHWHCGFAGESRLNRDAVDHELPAELLAIWQIIQPLCLPDNPVLLRGYANAHTYGTEGYPHIDSEHEEDRTAVVYLNDEWERHWGGETAFYSGREIVSSVMPKYGRVVTFPSAMWHCARSVSRLCSVARVTLVFKARPA